MTETEWEACSDPSTIRILQFARLGQRKQTLFICAYCRQVWDLLTDPRSRRAVEAGEASADGLADEGVLLLARREAEEVRHRPLDSVQRLAALLAELAATPGQQLYAAESLIADLMLLRAREKLPEGLSTEGYKRVRAATHAHIADLLRELLPYPFRSLHVPPALLSWEGGVVRHLAQAIYSEGRFHETSVLADALEEAGCELLPLVHHLRASRAHARGCWALDAILGLE